MSRAMKNSGIPWIGEIPSQWIPITPKALFTQRKDRAKDGERQLTASQQFGVVYQDEYTEITGYRVMTVLKDFEILKHVEAGDFVISMRSFQGGLEYSTKTGSISSAYVMLVPNLELVFPRYYRWLFKSVGYINALQSTSNMVRDGQAMRYSNFAQVGLFIVPLQEQQAIADILDKKCGEIDEMVMLQERTIQELKVYKQSVITETVTKGLNPNVPMKDSGIEWIGQMPKDWSIIRLRFLFSIIGGNGFKDEFQGQTDGDYPFLKTSDINGAQPYIRDAVNYVSKEIATSEKYNIIPINAIIVSKIGAAMHKNHRKISTRPCCIDNNLEALVPVRNDCIKYLYYLMRIVDFAWFDNQGTIPSVNNSKLKDFCVPDTPVQEQQVIADYLDSRCAEIDTLISLKQSKIEALKEYKKSIIYEYVTGKKELV